jgi:DHA3 family macrolide efflux protein-like MFS transporter
MSNGPAEPAQVGATTYGRILRNRSFVALWLGQTISFIGDYFYWLAVPIMVEKLTGSALQVGLSVIASALPMLLLGPVAGVFVDRWDRRRTMIVADIVRGLLVLACLLVRTTEQVWIYYVVAFLMSCVSRFFFPAQNAILPIIVPGKADLLAANGLMQIVQTAGFLIGPALAGFSIGLWGGQVAFVVESVTFFVSAAAILAMAVPRTTVGRQAIETAGRYAEIAAVWEEMRQGIVYLFGNRTMVGVLLCLAVVQLGVGAINVTWVPFMQRTFGLGPEGLGAVDTAQGVGMALGGVMLGFVAGRLGKKNLAGWSIVFIGGMIALMGMAPPFSLANLIPALQGNVPVAEASLGQRLVYVPLTLLLYSMLLGVALVPAQSALMTMMQFAVPDLKRGRVGSALNALTTAAGLTSMAASAALAEVVALRAIYVASGIIVSMAGLVGLVVLPGSEAQHDGQRQEGETEAVRVIAD